MAMWCPECRNEYRDGYTSCADCGAALVDALAPRAKRSPRAPVEPRAVSPGEDAVEVARLPVVEAELVAGQLRGAGIRAIVLGMDGATGSEMKLSQGSRVMVRRVDLDAALQVVADLSPDDLAAAPITEEELASLAEQSTGWSDPSSGAVV